MKQMTDLPDGVNRDSRRDSGSNIRPSEKFKIDETLGQSGEVEIPSSQSTGGHQNPFQSRIRELKIDITDSDLEDQRETLIHEFDLSERVADSLYDVFLNLVEEEVERQNKNWSQEVIEAVTNIMIATAIREEKQRELLP
jgi:hypothetical protein